MRALPYSRKSFVHISSRTEAPVDTHCATMHSTYKGVLIVSTGL